MTLFHVMVTFVNFETEMIGEFELNCDIQNVLRLKLDVSLSIASLSSPVPWSPFSFTNSSQCLVRTGLWLYLGSLLLRIDGLKSMFSLSICCMNKLLILSHSDLEILLKWTIYGFYLSEIVLFQRSLAFLPLLIGLKDINLVLARYMRNFAKFWDELWLEVDEIYKLKYLAIHRDNLIVWPTMSIKISFSKHIFF